MPASVSVDARAILQKFRRMQQGSLLAGVEKRLKTEVDKSVKNVRRSLSKKWSKGGASAAGQPPKMRSGGLRESISGSVSRKKRGSGTVVRGRFGLFTRNKKIQARAFALEFGATITGTDKWLTVFTDTSLRADGTPIFKPKSNPDAPLTAGRVKNQGFVRTWVRGSWTNQKDLWVWGAKTGGQPVLLWVLTREVKIEARPFLVPEAESFVSRLESAAREGIQEAL